MPVEDAHAMDISAAIEAECFRQCGGTDTAWRGRFKVLHTSLKGSKQLRQAVLSGRLTAVEAVGMDSERLLAY